MSLNKAQLSVGSQAWPLRSSDGLHIDWNLWKIFVIFISVYHELESVSLRHIHCYIFSYQSNSDESVSYTSFHHFWSSKFPEAKTIFFQFLNVCCYSIWIFVAKYWREKKNNSEKKETGIRNGGVFTELIWTHANKKIRSVQTM